MTAIRPNSMSSRAHIQPILLYELDFPAITVGSEGRTVVAFRFEEENPLQHGINIKTQIEILSFDDENDSNAYYSSLMKCDGTVVAPNTTSTTATP